MSRHLSPGEFVDAAEGTLDAARAAHLSSCAGCAQELAAMRDALQQLSAAPDVPEPSPLYWDHFRARVGAAVRVPGQAVPWWRPRLGWRYAAAAAAVATAVALAVFMRPFAPTAVEPDGLSADAGPADVWLPALDDSSFDVVLGLASDLDWDDVRQVAAPRAGLADVLIQELTPSEREALVTLLKNEIGELE